jgi:hypothetical protein
MGRPRKQVENRDEEEEEEEEHDMDVVANDHEAHNFGKDMKKNCSSNFGGVKDIKGNQVLGSSPARMDYGSKETTISAIAVEQLQRTERYGSCYYIDGSALDIVEIAGKIIQRPNVFDNRVTFLLCDDCVSAALTSVMCIFWKVNNDNFEMHVRMLSNKNVRVFGVLDFTDRVILNVYSIQVVNSAELTYHALLVRYHSMKRVELVSKVSSVAEVLPMSKNFNKVDISSGTVSRDIQRTKVAVVDQHRFDVAPASVSQFLFEMGTVKSKRIHYEKVCGLIEYF